jgi:formylglycine-generating enzyme required for sulfatase activity
MPTILSVNSTPTTGTLFQVGGLQAVLSRLVLAYPLGTGLDGERMACADFSVDAASIYDCEGFRLPTESEWEYAARAGSRTAFYLGEHTKNPDPLERTHYNDPNGNISELTYSFYVMADFTEPMVDPVRLPNPLNSVIARGGLANGVPDMLRAAERAPSEPNGLGVGFRLVRTLKAGEVWPASGTK